MNPRNMNPKEALKYAMDLCSRQERCRSEVYDKLVSHRVPTTEINRILDALVEENFIDEARYAGSFARDKLRFNRWGKIKIRYMLEGKKLPQTIIDAALDDIDPEYYTGILREELRKKRRTIKGSNAFELRGKLFRFARQRGFEPERIYPLLDEIL